MRRRFRRARAVFRQTGGNIFRKAAHAISSFSGS